MRIIPSHAICGHTDKHFFRLRSTLRVSMCLRNGRATHCAVYKIAAKHWMYAGLLSFLIEIGPIVGFPKSVARMLPEKGGLLRRARHLCFSSRIMVAYWIALASAVWQAVNVPGNSFPTIGACRDGDGRRGFLRRDIVPRRSLWTLGVLSIIVDMCGTRMFCYSRLVPRFEQCSVRVNDMGMCAYLPFSPMYLAMGLLLTKGRTRSFLVFAVIRRTHGTAYRAICSLVFRCVPSKVNYSDCGPRC